jgi:hypothetical protein
LKKYLFIYISLISLSLFSQKREVDSLPKSLDEYILVKEGDTLTINLEEFSILPKHKFKSQEDVRYYFWFRRKVFKAYPFAKLASERLDSLNVRLSRIQKRSNRKKYTRRIQKYLEGEFTDQIKKMTTTEGRILIKLIHRQTGKTTFENIRGLRSGWKAFWYNTTANVFNLSLKEEYHPASVNEDYLIEDILQRAFLEEKLPSQKSKLTFDFAEISSERKGSIDVEEYKKMFAKQRKRNKRKKRTSSKTKK